MFQAQGRESQETDQAPITGLFRLRWESRPASRFFKFVLTIGCEFFPQWEHSFMSKKSITLVVGGVSSGKSRYAQALASTAEQVVFLATSQPSDDEMRAKIARHVQERPDDWKTVEVPFELEKA